MGRRDSVDVIIVGAGLAGLAAAVKLQEQGASVVVLEARDRVGGRTHSTEREGAWFDLGGQWIGPTQTRMAKLVADLGIETFPTFHEGKKVLNVGGKTSTYSGTIPSMSPLKLLSIQRILSSIERKAKRVDLDRPWSGTDAESLDGITVEAWKRRYTRSSVVSSVFDVGVRTVLGAEPSEISMQHFLFYAASAGGLMPLLEIEDGAQETRFVDGAQRVAEGLAATLGNRVVLDAPARRIETNGDGVEVHGDARSWRGADVVIAMAPVLAARLVYDPPLPARHDELAQRFPMGATIKAHVIYRDAFWRTEGFSGEAVLTSGPVSVVFDSSNRDGSVPALLAFAVGRGARELGSLSEDARRAEVLKALVSCFGPRAGEPTMYLDKDWSADPWTRGCPTGYMAPGVLTAFGSVLRQPVGPIHWAGTERATEWTGYMEGAVRSGERAAAEILDARG